MSRKKKRKGSHGGTTECESSRTASSWPLQHEFQTSLCCGHSRDKARRMFAWSGHIYRAGCSLKDVLRTWCRDADEAVVCSRASSPWLQRASMPSLPGDGDRRGTLTIAKPSVSPACICLSHSWLSCQRVKRENLPGRKIRQKWAAAVGASTGPSAYTGQSLCWLHHLRDRSSNGNARKQQRDSITQGF